jgi:predicted dehydrogenase
MIPKSYLRQVCLFMSLILIVVSFCPSILQAQSAPDTKFRIAILGLVHSHAWGHLRNMAKNTTIDVVAISDPNADMRELAAKEMPGVAMYDDYRKMLSEKKPQAVWSFVENDRHLEITQACAERGIHVLFEKPMAATHEQAKQMMDLARKHKIQLMVNYQMAWWPTNYAAHHYATNGDIGKIWRVRAIIGHGGPAPTSAEDVRGQRFWTWLNDEKRGGGALIDFTCYGAVWLRWYLGMPSSIYAVTTHTRPGVYNTNTSAAVLATFPENGVGLIEGSWDLPRSFQDVEIFGNKGSVFATSRGVEAYVGREKKDVPVTPLDETRRDPIAYFVGSIRSEKPVEGMVSPEFNLDVMKIVDAIRTSAGSGKPVVLQQK